MKETQEDWKDMPAAAKIHTFLRERDLMLSVQECDYLAQQILDNQKREIQQDMLVTCRDWHGSGEAMVNDYFNNLN